jgi:hypothetical protein
MRLDRRAARVAGVMIAVVLAGPSVAHAGQRPSAQELWRSYPLEPTPTASASAAHPTPTPTPRAARPPAARHSGGAPWLPIGLVALALGAAAAVALRRRRPGAPAPAPAPPPRRRVTPPPPPREFPWPGDIDGLWRCEVALAPAALSTQVEAVAREPGGGARTVLVATPSGPGGADWQSSEALDEAIAALAAELEARGWEPVAGGPPHARRLCWRHAGDPFARAEEAAWTA